MSECVFCKHEIEGKEIEIKKIEENLCEICLEDLRRYKTESDFEIFITDEISKELYQELSEAAHRAIQKVCEKRSRTYSGNDLGTRNTKES